LVKRSYAYTAGSAILWKLALQFAVYTIPLDLVTGQDRHPLLAQEACCKCSTS